MGKGCPAGTMRWVISLARYLVFFDELSWGQLELLIETLREIGRGIESRQVADFRDRVFVLEQ